MSPMSFNERIDAMIRANNFNGMQLTGNVRRGAPDWRGDLQENISQRLGLDRSGRKFLNKAMNVGEVVSGVGGVGAGIADTAQASSPTERNLMGALTALSIIPGMGAVTKYAKPALKNALYRSRLGPAIEAMPMDKMTGQQAASHFSKFPGGVGSDELNYTGVQGLLNQPQVTKSGLLDQYRANPLEIKDVIRREPPRHMSGSMTTNNQEIEYLRTRHRMMVEGSGDYADLPPSLREERAGRMLAQINAMEQHNVVGPTKFSDYTLPGGDDYQELLMTLPTNRSKYEKRLSEVKAAHGQPDDAVGFANWATKQEADELTRLADKSEFSNYQSGHYDEPNVLVHSRYNTRNVDGDKTLFIEEIQSDWHQAGRKKGYESSTAQQDYDTYANNLKNRAIIKFRDSLEEGRKVGYDVDTAVNSFKTASPTEHAKYLGKDEQKALQNAVKTRNIKKEGVPDAPYKSTDKWQGLAFSRLVRQAADGGHDRIAWTPGKMQADRYDLSKHLDTIRIEKLRDGKKAGQYYVTGKKNNYQHVAEVVTEENLHEMVGKELADRGIKDALQYPDGRDYTGLDLQVGGEGMKSFYDKMMVKTANKFAKKYGQKVEVKSLPKPFKSSAMTRDQMRKAGLPDDEPHVWSKIDNTFDSTADQSRPIVVRNHITNKETVFKTSAEADIFIDKETAKMLPGEEVWSLKLTPEMKKDILKGGVALSGTGVAATSLMGQEEGYY